MFPPRRILFPVDFSERSIAAAPAVASFARHFHAGLTLLHVLPPRASDDLRLRAQEDLGAFGWPLFSGMNSCQALVEGDPATEILGYAHDHKVDLIMMPTHGYGPFRRFLLGSVAEKVLRGADCAVWTDAHTAEPFHHRTATELKTVVCALDLSEHGRAALRWASQFGEGVGASLKIVHAVPLSVAVAVPDMPLLDWTPGLATAAEDSIARLQEEMGTNAPVEVVTGEVAFAVDDAAKDLRADLVVIGRGAYERGLGRMREHAYSIIRHSSVPVVSV